MTSLKECSTVRIYRTADVRSHKKYLSKIAADSGGDARRSELAPLPYSSSSAINGAWSE
jgi:hypothetical protein